MLTGFIDEYKLSLQQENKNSSTETDFLNYSLNFYVNVSNELKI